MKRFCFYLLRCRGSSVIPKWSPAALNSLYYFLKCSKLECSHTAAPALFLRTERLASASTNNLCCTLSGFGYHFIKHSFVNRNQAVLDH